MFLAIIVYDAGMIPPKECEITGTTRQELLNMAKDKERELGFHYRLSSIVHHSVSDKRDTTIWMGNRWLDAAKEFLSDSDEPML